MNLNQGQIDQQHNYTTGLGLSVIIEVGIFSTHYYYVFYYKLP